MTQVTLLREALRPYLQWHGARLAFLGAFLIALFQVKTVNLSEIATAFAGTAQPDSHYKRLHRFFREFELDYSTVARTVVGLMQIPTPWVLSLDRTQWQFGQRSLNILVLGIAHDGVAFPLIWTVLPKRGNSNTAERIQLMEQFLVLFGASQVAYLAADREFVGKDWLGYLRQHKISFRIRIRYSDTLSNGRTTRPARVVFQSLQPQEMIALPRRRRLWGYWVFVAGLRLEDGSLLVVISSESASTALGDYAKRWQIETLFGCFKRRGFCLESTHLSHPQRLSKLIALLSLALCWAHRSGQWLHQLVPLKLKKHGRRAKSLFRYGLDFLRRVLLNSGTSLSDFHKALQFLSST